MPRPNWDDLASPRCPLCGEVDEVFLRCGCEFHLVCRACEEKIVQAERVILDTLTN